MSTLADLRQVVIHLHPEPRISGAAERLLKPHSHFRRDAATPGNEMVKLVTRDAETFRCGADQHAKFLKAVADQSTRVGRVLIVASTLRRKSIGVTGAPRR